MPDIPLHYFQPQETPVANARINPNALSPISEGAQQLAGAASNLLEGFEARRKAALDYAREVTADTQMRAAENDFSTWVQTNPDPFKWQDEANKRAAKVRSSVLGGIMPPDVRIKMEANVQHWGALFTTNAKHMAGMQQLKIGQANVEDNVNAMIGIGDIDGAVGAIQTGQKLGYYDPVTAENRIKRVTRQGSVNQVADAITGDPFSAIDKLQAKTSEGSYVNYPELTPTDRLTQLARANKEAAATRQVSIAQISQQIFEAQNGKGPMPDKNELEALAKHQGWPAGAVKKMFSSVDYSSVNTPAGYVQLMNDIHAFHQDGSDEAQMQAFDIGRRINLLRGVTQERAKDLFIQKSDTSSKVNSEAYKQGEKVIQEAYKAGFLGQWVTTVRVPNPIDPNLPATTVKKKLPDVWEKANERQAALYSQLHDFVKENPNSTPVEVNKFVRDHIRPMLRSSAASLFSGRQSASTSQSDQSKAIDSDSLKSLHILPKTSKQRPTPAAADQDQEDTQ